MSQTRETVRLSLEVLEASLERLEQLRRETLVAGQDTADIDLARAEARAERDRLAIIQAHLEAAATAIEPDPAQAAALGTEGRELARLIQSQALLDAALDTISQALATARRVADACQSPRG